MDSVRGAEVFELYVGVRGAEALSRQHPHPLAALAALSLEGEGESESAVELVTSSLLPPPLFVQPLSLQGEVASAASG